MLIVNHVVLCTSSASGLSFRLATCSSTNNYLKCYTATSYMMCTTSLSGLSSSLAVPRWQASTQRGRLYFMDFKFRPWGAVEHGHPSRNRSRSKPRRHCQSIWAQLELEIDPMPLAVTPLARPFQFLRLMPKTSSWRN